MSAIATPLDPNLTDESDAALLGIFSQHRAEAAFEILVHRHSGWVQGVAQRSLSDVEAARDVTQQVFIHLARKASRIKPDALGPWLHRTTILECRNARRRESARQRSLAAVAREGAQASGPSAPDPAWRDALPLLDEAVHALPERDRTLILLRFFEKRNWRDIGSALGRNEDAARMALTPALEKLSVILRRRGAVVSAGTLAAALGFAGKGVPSAPAASLTTHALAAPVGTRLTLAGWGMSAACLLVGGAAGWQFSSPPPEARSTMRDSPAAPSKRPSPVASAPSVLAREGGFDLNAVLHDLSRLQPVGNDPGMVVRLRSVFADLPPEAVSPILAVLRTRRWGDDTVAVAESFFHRWAGLDPQAAWAQIREPDLLGASYRTVPAVFDGLPKGRPDLFVRMMDSLPSGGRFSYALTPAMQAHFGSLSVAELLPLVDLIRLPSQRGEVLSPILDRPQLSAEDCAGIAPVLASIPLTRSANAMKLTERWAKLDAPAVKAWAMALPDQSPLRWAAVTGLAKSLSAQDPAAAGRLIAEVPWIERLQPELESITRRWMAVDEASALAWLNAGADLPAPIRARLQPQAHKKEDEP